MSAGYRIAASLVALVLGLSGACVGQALPGPGELRAAYQGQVDRRLEVPPDESLRYGQIALDALAAAGADSSTPQYVGRSEPERSGHLHLLAGAGDLARADRCLAGRDRT